MSLQRFFHSGILKEGQTIILSREESHHLVKVMRAADKEPVEVIDGVGGLAVALVEKANPKAASLFIQSFSRVDPVNRIRLCFAIPKSAAMDFIIRRCTEMGVEAFQPLITNHSVHLHKDWNKERWERVVIEVSKQCQELYFPAISPPLSLSHFFEQRDPQRPLLFCSETHRELKTISASKATAFDLLIGAEGGWSQDEIETVTSRRATFFGLGKNRLRAETAALVSLTLLKKEAGEL
jgi:16S rRNA (uracil1498-N3)-methyltransferase